MRAQLRPGITSARDVVRATLKPLRGTATAAFAESAETIGLTRVEAFALALERGIECEKLVRRWAAEPSRPAAGGAVRWLEDGDGPGVVIINGWTLSSRVWPADLLGALAATHRVVRPDNRGTGQRWSDRSVFTIADLAGDVRDVMGTAGLDRPIVVGFSMGGMVALELALRWPERVGGLVLVASRPPSPAGRAGQHGTLGRALRPPSTDRPLPEQFRERWAAVCAPGFADAHPERLEEMAVAAFAPVTSRRTVVAQARAFGGWNGGHRLRRLQVPTTVVHGACDPLSPAANSRRLAELIPDARYIELPGVGHLVPQEAPERLAAIVADVRDTTAKERR